MKTPLLKTQEIANQIAANVIVTNGLIFSLGCSETVDMVIVRGVVAMQDLLTENRFQCLLNLKTQIVSFTSPVRLRRHRKLCSFQNPNLSVFHHQLTHLADRCIVLDVHSEARIHGVAVAVPRPLVAGGAPAAAGHVTPILQFYHLAGCILKVDMVFDS